ncbi:MAG: ATP-binding protein [Defluviitaleaceae bacterium]|nr:ATP-binding protein [Defluviitaleaceae bacterium]
MKTATAKRLKKLLPLMVLPIVLGVSYLILYTPLFLTHHAVYSENGVWDLRDFDFEENYVRLYGYPLVIDQTLLNPEEFAQRSDEAQRGSTFYLDFATSRMVLLVPDDTWFTFSRVSAHFSQRIYVNGALVAQIGSPGECRETQVPDIGRVMFSAQAVDGIIEIVQQSSNFVHRDGGHHQHWYAGESTSGIGEHFFASDLRTAILVGGFFILSLVMFLLFFMWGNHGTLYSGLFCLVWFLRTGLVDGRIFTVVLPWMDWYTKIRIEYISIPASAALIVAIINRIFPGVLQKPFLRIVYIFSGVTIITYMFADVLVMSTHILFVTYGVFGLCLLYVLFRFITKVRKPHMEQLIFMAGVLLFFFASIMDVFYFTFIDATFRIPLSLTGAGILVFVFCKATAVTLVTMNQLNEARSSAERLEIAEENSRQKSDFLAKMSHEIRTPMNAILGMTELIMREDLPKQARDQATTIKHSGGHLLSIVNDILDFSKIESGRMDIAHAPYLFHSTIYDVVSIIKMRHANPLTQFYVYVDKNIPNQLMGDEVRMRQVLLNILSNAEKYTTEGHFALEVFCDITDDVANLTIQIKDTGIGIKESDLVRLFDDFAQFDLEKNLNAEGTGLGLPITQNLVNLMGGTLTATSKYGVGSQFTLTLPQKLAGESRETPTFPDKSVLLFCRTALTGNYLARAMDDLGITYKITRNEGELEQAMYDRVWDFVFAEAEMAYKVQPIAKNKGLNPQIVMLTDSYDAKYEARKGQDISILLMPAYSLPVISTLTGEDSIYTQQNQRVELFHAPEAKILVVDDIETNLMVARGLLAPYKSHITTCASGQEAIDAMLTQTFDIIFMDHMMPVMDGIEATRIIRAGGNSMPIIALTANAIVGAREMFLENGFDDFISKPIDINKLNDLLVKWIPEDKQIQVEHHQEQDDQVEDGEPQCNRFNIVGIDADLGLSRVGGSHKIYQETLAIFHKEATAKIPQLAECIERDDWHLYTIYIHALKSASNNVGATALSEQAGQLEGASKADNLSFVRENHGNFVVGLLALLGNVKVHLTQTTQDKQQGDFDPEALKSALAKLRVSLETMDLPAIDPATEALEVFVGFSQVSDAINSISEVILMGDYKQAITEIDNLNARW